MEDDDLGFSEIFFPAEDDSDKFHTLASGLINNCKTITATTTTTSTMNTLPVPGADIKEYTDKYEFIVDMPGLTSKDIEIQILCHGCLNELVISGERKETTMPSSTFVKDVLAERSKILERSLALPNDAGIENISAACDEGLLIVTLPKVLKAWAKIEIQGSKRKRNINNDGDSLSFIPNNSMELQQKVLTLTAELQDVNAEIKQAEASQPSPLINNSGCAGAGNSTRTTTSTTVTSITVPCADINEYTDKYEYIVDLPGLTSDDLKIDLDSGYIHKLVISGERNETVTELEGSSLFVSNLLAERNKVLERIFNLPYGADVESISSVCYNGLLRVTLPRLPKQQQPVRRLKIKWCSSY